MEVIVGPFSRGRLWQGTVLLLLWTASLGGTSPGPGHQASYTQPGTEWHVWESLGNPGRSATYSMWLRAQVEPEIGEATFHVTCSGRRVEAYLRTSFVVSSEKNERYQKDLVTVRLHFSGETATRTYLFSPLEDDRGFYVYNFERSVEGPEKGIERFLEHSAGSLEFEDSAGSTVKASLELEGMSGLYSSLQRAGRSGVSVARIDPSLLAADGHSLAGETQLAGQGDAATPSAPSSNGIDKEKEGGESSSLNVFGLSKGLTLPEIAEMTGASPVQVPQQPDLYILPRIPVENPDFEVYLALVPEGKGLAEMRAVGVPIRSEGRGGALREAFYRNVALLEKLFGKARVLDTAGAGNLEAPDGWMADLARGAARIMARWPGGEAPELSEDLDRILLAARSESESVARLVLQISFSNRSPGPTEAQETLQDQEMKVR